MSSLTLNFDDVARAQAQLAGVAHRTPVLTSATANALTGGQLFFKCENFQRTGAFKFRGAYHALAQLDAAQRARGVVAFSGGNHAQGIALSGHLLDMLTVIAMPSDAPAAKVLATRGYGGEVLFYDRHGDDRTALAKQLSEQRGLALIPSFDHPLVMAGQGTVAMELIEEVGPLDLILAPLGGGGLLSGVALAAHALSPACRVIGVEPQAGNDGQQSLQQGRIVHIPVPDTIADGAQAQHLGQHTFPVIQRHVQEIVTVDDEALVSAMRFFVSRMKMMVEPTGCLAAAAVLGQHIDVRGLRVGVVISGGNVDLRRFAALMQ